VAGPAFDRNGSDVVVDIGGLPVRLCVEDPAFLKLLEERYAGFLTASGDARYELNINLAPSPVSLSNLSSSSNSSSSSGSSDEDVRVLRDSGQWVMERADFRAAWDPSTGRGHIRQTANPYSIDSVLRILHTLLLTSEAGFLVHAASVVRNGRAFLFAGVSGAGKTTIAKLAPPDAILLTDEISYVRRQQGQYYAFGTPFTGELARLGENLRAPLAAVYLLAKGPENTIEPMTVADASCALLRNILFFARDDELSTLVFQAACDCVCRLPVSRLTFVPDARVWELVA
jgi:hypothetical protein